MSVWSEYIEILTDPAHSMAEISYSLLIDGLLLGLLFPLIRRRIKGEHEIIDAEHGYSHRKGLFLEGDEKPSDLREDIIDAVDEIPDGGIVFRPGFILVVNKSDEPQQIPPVVVAPNLVPNPSYRDVIPTIHPPQTLAERAKERHNAERKAWEQAAMEERAGMR